MKPATHHTSETAQQANQPSDFAPFHQETRAPICTKVMRQHPNLSEKNKLTAQHAPDRKANQELGKPCANKAHVTAGCYLLLLFWVVIIAAQGAVKAATGVELWSDPVLIAITVNARLVFLRLIGSALPLSRSAGERGRKKKLPAPRK